MTRPGDDRRDRDDERAERGERDPGGNGDPFAAARAAMLATQLRPRGVHDPRVLAAMAAVPRDAFVPRYLRDSAYADEALPIDHEQTISQPLMVGLMTQLLEAEPGQRVLEVGTGSGYQAAVLAEMGCRVTSVERIAELADAARDRLAALGYAKAAKARVAGGKAEVAEVGVAGGSAEAAEGRVAEGGAGTVEVILADGSAGIPGEAPWPRIIVAAAAPRVPDALADQLADGGRLVIPVGRRYEQELLLVRREGDRLRTTSHGACVFVPLIGAGGYR